MHKVYVIFYEGELDDNKGGSSILWFDFVPRVGESIGYEKKLYEVTSTMHIPTTCHTKPAEVYLYARLIPNA